MIRTENIHDSLETVFDHFDTFCREHSCFYNIVSDEHNVQGYVLQDRKLTDEMIAYITPVALARKVHVSVDRKRPDGVLFTFTISALGSEPTSEPTPPIVDGYWKPLPKHPKRTDYSPFANDKDAKKVAAGKTMYQTKKGFAERLGSALEAVGEGQYKSPTSKHTRSQSAFRSTFGKSRSYGGVKEAIAAQAQAGNIAGSSIPPQVEAPSSLGTVSADRTTGIDGKGKVTQSYATRKDLTDIPTKPPTRLESLLKRLDERLSSADDNQRSIMTNKYVPDAMIQPANPVVPDSTVAQQAMDPSGGMQNPDIAQQAMSYTLIGSTRGDLPIDNAAAGDRTIDDSGADSPRTNTRTSNLRDFNGPQTTDPLTHLDPKPDGNIQMPLRDPIPPGKVRANKARIHPVAECVTYRPEDGYDLMQQLVRVFELNTEARKIVETGRTFVKACDGDVRLEFDEPGKLTVYKQDKKIRELYVDLSKNTVVDDIVRDISKLLGN